MKAQVAALVLGLSLAGCGQPVDGAATPREPGADLGFFFAGEVPAYGQTVGTRDAATLAHLRAMRRLDVCGFVEQATLDRLGDVTAMSTLYAFDECDVEVKVPGAAEPKFFAVSLDLAKVEEPPSFRAGDVPVYESAPRSCEYLIPVALDRLPEATLLRDPVQPLLRVARIGARDCDLARQFAAGVAESVGTAPLPPRDAAARYPVPLAERDPCEVLSELAEDVDSWDIAATRPYACEFTLWRDGDRKAVDMRVGLQPKIVDIVTEGTRRLKTPDGDELFLDPKSCTATVFTGPAMQRRLAGGDFVDVDNVVVRPAVTVEGGGGDCSAAVDVAGVAARVFG